MSSFLGGPYGFNNYWPQPYGNLYGSLSLTESSPPQVIVEPLSVGEMATYLRLPPNLFIDPAMTGEMQGFITAARSEAETQQDLLLVRKQVDMVYDSWPSYRIELRGPVISVDLIQYTDSNGNVNALTENTDYLVDKKKWPAVISPTYNKTWPNFVPWPSSGVLIRYTGGFDHDAAWWSDGGATVKPKMKILISEWWNKRSASEKGPIAEMAIVNMMSRIPRAR